MSVKTRRERDGACLRCVRRIECLAKEDSCPGAPSIFHLTNNNKAALPFGLALGEGLCSPMFYGASTRGLVRRAQIIPARLRDVLRLLTAALELGRVTGVPRSLKGRRAPGPFESKRGYMKLMLSLCWLLRLWLIPMNAFPQSADSQKRMQEILASLNRKEHRVVERHGVRVEKYREIRSEPVVKQNAREYAGRYTVPDRGYTIEIRVGDDARVEGTGIEAAAGGGKAHTFTLKNGKIDGALLTADKLYEDGTTQKFEGVFITRTEFNSPQERGVSSFGIGAVGQPLEVEGGVRRDRLFYQRQDQR